MCWFTYERGKVGYLTSLPFIMECEWRPDPVTITDATNNGSKSKRRRIKRLLDENPSLAPRLEKAFENAYGDEILIAAREMDCDKNIFPTVYPFTQKQALDSDYWLD